MPEEVVSLVRRGKLSLDIRCAVDSDLPAVLELIDEAKLWLPTKKTNQWSKDWADQKGRKRSDRVQAPCCKERLGLPPWCMKISYTPWPR